MRGVLWWGVGVVSALAVAGRPEAGVVRTGRIELVGPDGRVVARLAARGDGAELVLGGDAQASLVTEGGVAALNLAGSEGLLRAVADDDARLSLHGAEDGGLLRLVAGDDTCRIDGTW